MPATTTNPTPQATDLPRRPSRNGRPRLAVWGLLAVAFLPALTGFAVLELWVRQRLQNADMDAAKRMADAVAAAVSTRPLAAGKLDQDPLLNLVGNDPRLTFLCVTDARDAIAYTRIRDANAWTDYLRHHAAAGPGDRVHPNELGMVHQERRQVVVSQAIVKFRTDAAPEATAPVRGAVILGFKEPTLGAALWAAEMLLLAAPIAVAVVLIPQIRAAERRWHRDMADLVSAIQRLAEGFPPQPVKVSDRAELGYLSAAFNQMAGQLAANRRALLEANAELEERVRQRTEQLERANRTMNVLASQDPLTGLANRRIFTEFLEEQCAKAARQGSDLTCLMIDMDGFKPVNDTLGHKAGDEILLLLAQALRESCRASDLVARLGGDEFAIALPGAGAATAQEIAGQVRQRFAAAAEKMLAGRGPSLAVNMSIGVASLRESQASTAEELVCLADTALYAAKGAGRACTVVSGGRAAA